MKTTLLLIIISSLSFICKGQPISQNEYIDITKAVLSDNELVQNLIENSKFESHPIFTKDRIFILDTTFVSKEIIYNENSPKFSITNHKDLNTSYINYWMTPINIEIKANKAIYEFKTQSLNYHEPHNYIKGKIALRKINDCWIIKKTVIENYEFLTQRDLECSENYIECKTSSNRPKKSKTGSPFFGDWQYINDSLYYEIFFTDDSIFHYNEIMGIGFYDLSYKYNDSIITIIWPDSTEYYLNYEVLNKNEIHLYGKNKSSFETVEFFYEDYTMERIKSVKIKLSDINCWGIWNETYKCFVESTDNQKYSEAFFNRMVKYKIKKLR